MKRNIIIWVLGIALIAVALYVSISFNKNNGGNTVLNDDPKATALKSLQEPQTSNEPEVSQIPQETQPVQEVQPTDLTPTKVLPTAKASPTSKKSVDVPEGITVDSKAINFSLTGLDGKKVSLSDFIGKNVYLNFFATWCPPCKAEMPDIEKIYQEYKDKDLVVIAVDLGEGKETVNSFISKNKYSFKVLLDSDQSVADKYSITAIPVSYFINKDGIIVKSMVGGLDENTMKQYVDALYK